MSEREKGRGMILLRSVLPFSCVLNMLVWTPQLLPSCHGASVNTWGRCCPLLLASCNSFSAPAPVMPMGGIIQGTSAGGPFCAAYLPHSRHAHPWKSISSLHSTSCPTTILRVPEAQLSFFDGWVSSFHCCQAASLSNRSCSLWAQLSCLDWMYPGTQSHSLWPKALQRHLWCLPIVLYAIITYSLEFGIGLRFCTDGMLVLHWLIGVLYWWRNTFCNLEYLLFNACRWGQQGNAHYHPFLLSMNMMKNWQSSQPLVLCISLSCHSTLQCVDFKNPKRPGNYKKHL